jgi:hypothetical protein
MALLMGFAVYLYAAVGTRISSWPRRWARGLGWAVLASMFLALGTRIPVLEPYALLYLLPGWDGIRTPGRLVVWTTILLAIAAAGAVTAITELLRGTATRTGAGPETAAGPLPRLLQKPAILRLLSGPRPAVARAVGGLAAALVLVEGLMVVEHLEVPEPPAALTSAHADQVRPPLMVLPSNNDFDALLMLWSTDGFPSMVNGLSGFTPHAQDQLRNETHNFPDPQSVALLRDYGVRTVVVLCDRVVDTPWAGACDRNEALFGITRTKIDNAVVYSLD